MTALTDLSVDKGAEFSTSRTHRYSLWRRLWPGSPLVVIGLNPSTADECADDQTIRRGWSYAAQLGARGLIMVNLYGLRSRDPKALWTADHPIDAADEILRNDRSIEAAAVGARLVLAAWGDFPRARDRAIAVAARLAHQGVTLHVLGLTKTGAPLHLSRVRNGLVPRPWTPT